MSALLAEANSCAFLSPQHLTRCRAHGSCSLGSIHMHQMDKGMKTGVLSTRSGLTAGIEQATFTGLIHAGESKAGAGLTGRVTCTGH